MAENIPNTPGGAVPPKKETGKVQPKKETVRINLPPKPTAAPTIKLPTLPPSGHTGAPGVAPAAPAAAPAPAKAAPAPAAPRASAAPIAQQQRPATAPRRPAAAAAAGPTFSTADMVLAISAGVAGLIAVGSTLYMAFFVLQ